MERTRSFSANIELVAPGYHDGDGAVEGGVASEEDEAHATTRSHPPRLWPLDHAPSCRGKVQMDMASGGWGQRP